MTELIVPVTTKGSRTQDSQDGEAGSKTSLREMFVPSSITPVESFPEWILYGFGKYWLVESMWYGYATYVFGDYASAKLLAEGSQTRGQARENKAQDGTENGEGAGFVRRFFHSSHMAAFSEKIHRELKVSP
jgi:hypothetical protein